MGTRYHLLPSEVLARADTLDYWVMDVAMTWHQQQQQQADAKTAQVRPPNIPVNKLQEMIDRVRKR